MEYRVTSNDAVPPGLKLIDISISRHNKCPTSISNAARSRPNYPCHRHMQVWSPLSKWSSLQKTLRLIMELELPHPLWNELPGLRRYEPVSFRRCGVQSTRLSVTRVKMMTRVLTSTSETPNCRSCSPIFDWVGELRSTVHLWGRYGGTPPDRQVYARGYDGKTLRKGGIAIYTVLK